MANRLNVNWRKIARSSGCGIGFGILLIVGAVILSRADPAGEAHILRVSSTSVRNLGHFPLRTLVTSIMWVPDGFVGYWIIVGMIGFIICQAALGWVKTLFLAFVSHVVATLASEFGVLVLVRLHQLPRHHLDDLDVGPSYVVVSVLIASIVLTKGKARLLAVLAIVPLVGATAIDLVAWDLASTGHLITAACAALLAVAERPGIKPEVAAATT